MRFLIFPAVLAMPTSHLLWEQHNTYTKNWSMHRGWRPFLLWTEFTPFCLTEPIWDHSRSVTLSVYVMCVSMWKCLGVRSVFAPQSFVCLMGNCIAEWDQWVLHFSLLLDHASLGRLSALSLSLSLSLSLTFTLSLSLSLSLSLFHLVFPLALLPFQGRVGFGDTWLQRHGQSHRKVSWCIQSVLGFADV